MKGCLLLLALALQIALHYSGKADGKNVICYYANWSQYRPGSGKFLPEDINPKICTHIIFAFAGLESNRLTTTEWNDNSYGYPKGLYQRVIDLKKINPRLKVMLAVGGWTAGTESFSEMASTWGNRQQFITTSISYLRNFGFDGLDIDWEFPAYRGGPAIDKTRFSYLVTELRNAFEKEARETGQERLLLSAAVSAVPSVIDGGYEVYSVSDALDMINLMAYDLHGSWDTRTGHNAALYPWTGDPTPQFTVDYAARYWVSKGADKKKIQVGVPMYGNTYTLANTWQTGMGAPVTGGGRKTTYSESGIMLYYEVCEHVLNKYKVTHDNEMKVPYASSGDQWVAFDDERGVATKMDWIIDEGYGGAMIWAIDLDDFSGGFCGKPYPLLSIISNCLIYGKGSTKCRYQNSQSPWSPQTTTKAPWVPPPTTTQKPWQPPVTTTPKPYVPATGGFTCPSAPGLFADPYSCNKFHICFAGNDYVLSCPAGLGFDDTVKSCSFNAC